jgi:hypothetical protein
VLAEGASLLEDADLPLARTARLLAEAGKLDGAGEAGRAGTDDEDVHFYRVGARRLSPDDPVERKVALVVGWDDGHAAEYISA